MTAPATDAPPSVALAGRAAADLARHHHRDLDRWQAQLRALRGCAEPVRLSGERITLDAATGEVLRHYTTDSEPHGQLMIRCGNRRASRCPSCAETYRADTFHLIRAGLLGADKGMPPTVREQPRVFATLTAPSFGPVHTGPDNSGTLRVCHPRRDGPACFARHTSDDPALGQPIDPETYDYVGQVLWNALAGDLWRRFTVYLRRHLAQSAGVTQRQFHRLALVSYAKVAEYQTRGVAHFHAVIRLDGRPTDPDSGELAAPPTWATVDLLDGAIRSAAAAVALDTPEATPGGPRTLTWGSQVDIRPVTAFPAGEAITEQAVAGYVAKYATKAAETSGTLDRRVYAPDLAKLNEYGVTGHAAALIRTCWTLGNPETHPELAGLKLRRWAHMLGFRGHFSTKSRHYSTTLGALRRARADYRHAQHNDSGEGESTLVLAHWRFAGQGYTPSEVALAAALTPSETGPTQEGGTSCRDC